MNEKPVNEKEAKFTLEMLMGLAKARGYIDASDIQNLRRYIKYLLAIDKMCSDAESQWRGEEILPERTVQGAIPGSFSYRVKNLSKKTTQYIRVTATEDVEE